MLSARTDIPGTPPEPVEGRGYPHPVRRTLARRGAVALLVAALVPAALVGCGADGSSSDGSSPDGPSASASSPAPAPPVSVPADGLSLSALGLTNGPVDRVFVPVGVRVSSLVDQPDNVTVVMTAPPAAELAAFYRRTAVANGFTLTADDPARTTLRFTGLGWTGTFTGDAQASALLLRPAS